MSEFCESLTKHKEIFLNEALKTMILRLFLKEFHCVRTSIQKSYFCVPIINMLVWYSAMSQVNRSMSEKTEKIQVNSQVNSRYAIKKSS